MLIFDDSEKTLKIRKISTLRVKKEKSGHS
jgi:hypothetical protein